jgi:hypothetical protein
MFFRLGTYIFWLDLSYSVKSLKRNTRNYLVDVRGSVQHSKIHKKNPTRCNNVSKFHYSIFT